MHAKAYAQFLLAEAIREQKVFRRSIHNRNIPWYDNPKNSLFKNRLVLQVVEKVKRECEKRGIPCRVKATSYDEDRNVISDYEEQDIKIRKKIVKIQDRNAEILFAETE